MNIEMLKCADLIPYARNAKTHSPEQVAAIAGSIKEFGFNGVVLVDKSNGIIAGHGRVLAAQKLGMEEVPCVRLEHLSESQKRAFILADNKLAERGGWNPEMLALELDQLLADGVKVAELGITNEEMAKLSKQFLDLENPIGWTPDMIPVSEEERKDENTVDITDNTYCAFRNSKCIDLVTGPCLHACTYCFVRTSKAGLSQKGLKPLAEASLKRAITEVSESGANMISIGSCMDPCVKPARELLVKALRQATSQRVFVELQTKDPAAALEVIKQYDIPVELVSVKASFSMLSDEGAKSAEPGAPLFSSRLEAMRELTSLGVDVLFRHCPLIFGYLPENIGEIVKSSGARAYFFEPLRLAATTIAHNVGLGKALTNHGGDIYKWVDAYMGKNEDGKPSTYGAMHYYSYDSAKVFPELEKIKATIEATGLPFSVCSGFYGLGLEQFNTVGRTPYGCWTPNRERANVAIEPRALHCRICSGRMDELRPKSLSNLSEPEKELEINRMLLSNLTVFKTI